jgi:uncharacterized membrane protein HdeD (DUF308 family)
MANPEFSGERMQSVAAGLQAGATSKLTSGWRFFLIRGGIAIALGLVVIFWPGLSFRTLALILGLYCVADGVTTLVGGLRHAELWEQLAQALVVLAVGVVLLLWPGTTFRTLMLLLGLVALAAGISQFLSARRLPEGSTERGTLLKIAIAEIVVGLVLILWPGSGMTALSLVVGTALILIGALLIFLGSRLKGLRTRVQAL